MLTTSYRAAQWLRLTAFVILIIAIVWTIFKFNLSYIKINDFSRAEAHYDETDHLDAFLMYKSAKDNKWIKYKEAEIDVALIKLSIVSDILEQMQDIITKVQKAETESQFELLLSTFKIYQNINDNANNRQSDYAFRHQEIISYLKVDEAFERAFNSAKKNVANNLANNIKNNTFPQDSLNTYLKIPTKFFDSEEARMEEIVTQLTAYDEARFDLLVTNKNLDEVVIGELKLQQFYADLDVQADWLISKLESYMLDYFTELIEQNDISSFIQHVILIEETQDLIFPSDKVAQLIQESIENKFAEVEQLRSDGKFQESIDLLTDLGSYIDTVKLIQDVKLQWVTEEPLHLLELAASHKNYTSIANGENQLGSLVYSIGLSTGELTLARLLSDMKIDKKEVSLDQNFKMQKIDIINNLSAQGLPVIVLEGESTDRMNRYIAFELRSDGLRQSFDFQADKYEIEKPGRIVVHNPTGTGAGQSAYFTSVNGVYSYDGIKPDYVDIKIANLANYRNTKVRFNCTILAADGKTAVVLHNGEYIMLSGNMTFSTGNATVTGTWTTTAEIKKGEESIPAYNFVVATLTQ